MGPCGGGRTEGGGEQQTASVYGSISPEILILERYVFPAKMEAEGWERGRNLDYRSQNTHPAEVRATHLSPDSFR